MTPLEMIRANADLAVQSAREQLRVSLSFDRSGVEWLDGHLIVLRQRRRATTELTPNEAKIRDLVREVYASKIVSEAIVRNGSDAVLTVELHDEKMKSLQVNLSSLARKHEEGASLPALKTSLRFD